MNWFLIALVNPIAHALVNHLDKYLISKYLKGGSVGTLVLFSSLFAVVVLPVIYFIHPTVFDSITLSRAVVLMINGALLVTAIICYLYALETDEASFVAPFFQLVPVFGFVFGFAILGEILNFNQLLAAGLIVLGGTLLSLEFAGGRARVKSKLVLLMLASSGLYAVNAVIFKSIAINQGFLDSLFWDMLGKVIFGIILFSVVKSYREQFVQLLKSNRFSILGLNVINEVLALVGEIALVLAVLAAPVVLVQSVSGLQPAFVLIIGVVLTLFFPKISKESLEAKHIAQKVIAITIISVGVYLLQTV
jgi:uncharacterized membrane protein